MRVMFHVELWTVPVFSPRGLDPSDPFWKREVGAGVGQQKGKFMSWDSPLRLNVVDRAAGERKRNAVTKKWHSVSLYCLPFRVGFVNWQFSSLERYCSHFQKCRRECWITKKKKEEAGAAHYFIATPSTFAGGCLLRCKRNLRSCLLFFILFHSSNPQLITLPIFLYLLAKLDLAATSSVFEESQKVLG